MHDDERIGHLLRLIRKRSGTDPGAARDNRSCAARRRDRRRGGPLCERPTRSTAEHVRRGGRPLDERHAALVERVVRLYSEFGERGSIDVLGIAREPSAAAVCEVKSAFGSLEETNRSLGVKVRLAPGLVRDQWAGRRAPSGASSSSRATTRFAGRSSGTRPPWAACTRSARQTSARGCEIRSGTRVPSGSSNHAERCGLRLPRTISLRFSYITTPGDPARPVSRRM